MSQTPSVAFRHLPPKEGCRKPVAGVCVCVCVFGGLGGSREGGKVGGGPLYNLVDY